MRFILPLLVTLLLFKRYINATSRDIDELACLNFDIPTVSPFINRLFHDELLHKRLRKMQNQVLHALLNEVLHALLNRDLHCLNATGEQSPQRNFGCLSE